MGNQMVTSLTTLRDPELSGQKVKLMTPIRLNSWK